MQLDAVRLMTADATVLTYMEELTNTYEVKIKEIQNKYETRIKELELKNLELKEENSLLLYKKFARSAEQLAADEKQLLLFSEAGTTTSSEKKTVEFIEVSSHKRNKKGRKALAAAIERREKIIDISESEKTCACGATMTRIGEETSEKLVIIPARIYVEKTIRPQYACRCCEGTEDEDRKVVRIAQAEPTLIPRSIVSPGLLSTIMTQKYEMHLPYFRQEKQFKSIGIRISRQDMSNWQQKAYTALEPLFCLMKEAVKGGPYIQMDETTVQVMGEEGRKDTQKSYMWLARGGPPGKPVVWYEYHKTRAASHAIQFLKGYCGYLQTDGYEGYDAAVKELPGIIHVGCLAHARRYFFEAAKVTSEQKSDTPSLAEEGMNYIKKLYVIEKAVRDRYPEEEQKNKFTRVRQLCAFRPLKEFKEWLLKGADEVPPTLLLGKAIHYSLEQWDKLVRYLESPYLTPDNNAAENGIRPFVLGRRNWLFNKSPEGAESSCGMYTLIETAKQNGLVPFKYLMALFENAPLVKTTNDWEKLLPWNVIYPKN